MMRIISIRSWIDCAGSVRKARQNRQVERNVFMIGHYKFICAKLINCPIGFRFFQTFFSPQKQEGHRTQRNTYCIGHQIIHIKTTVWKQVLHPFRHPADAEGEQPQRPCRERRQPAQKKDAGQIDRGMQQMVGTQPEHIVVQGRHTVQRQPHQQQQRHKVEYCHLTHRSHCRFHHV